MTSLLDQLLSWFSVQPQFTQFMLTGLWSFLCGLIFASFCLWFYFQNYCRRVLEHQAAIAVYEKRSLEDKITTGKLLCDTIRQQCAQLTAENNKQSRVISELREQQSLQRSDNARLQTQIEQEQIHTAEKLSLLNEAREQLRLQFAELAAGILEEKSASFSKESQEKFAILLSPFHEQLSSFRQKVDEIHHTETRDRAALQREIASLRSLNQQMSTEAINLTRALKGDKRIQGTWGELVLEKVLEQSALRKGVEYETQAVFRDEKNRFQRPDVVVHLPEGRDIIIDSKVSLIAWERYVSCEDENEQKVLLQSHVRAIGKHVRLLGEKDYGSLTAIRSLDFVLMFMPVEAAFLAAFQADDTLFAEAISRKIILVSPTTLLTTLQTIESIWRYEKQSRNAREIAEKAGALYDKFCSFTEDMERIGKQMNALQNSYESAMVRLSQGRGNLISRVERFPQMGVKAKKKIPKSIIDQADLS
ncbi:MAG TPA: DNA recombination protein RmuC [Desulfobacterales bacterium]|nr:DNA recombination protein RmuC [Desulfobacterales bacterium]